MNRTTQGSMTSELVTINWSARMGAAFERMQKNHLRHLPVTDDHGEIVGMLSDRDVQRAMISRIERERFSPLSTETVEFDPEARVRDYMGWPVLTADANEDLQKVAVEMLDKKVSSLLVQKEGRTVGIITTDDLIRVLIGLLNKAETPARLSLRDLISGATHRLDGVLV